MERGSAEVGAVQPSSAALNLMGIYRFINAKQQKAAVERKVRVPLRYQLAIVDTDVLRTVIFVGAVIN
jgi:hypothetical protein